MFREIRTDLVNENSQLVRLLPCNQFAEAFIKYVELHVYNRTPYDHVINTFFTYHTYLTYLSY